MMNRTASLTAVRQSTLLRLLCIIIVTIDLVSPLDSFCGTSYFQAVSDCLLECNGQDADCTDALGEGYSCFMFTGCSDSGDNATLTPSPVNSTAGDGNDGNVTILFDGDETALANNSTATPVSIAPTGKTSKPTASPTPDPHLASLQTASPKELDSGNSVTTILTSYGFIFNVRTSSTSSAVSIVGLDILTASTSDLDYELYSTIGPYNGIKGMFGRWVLVAKGVVTGSGLGSYTSIVMEEPIPMDGKGSVRAFYVSFGVKDMMFRMTAVGANPDEAIQQSTDELELYEGEAVQAFPFPESDVAGGYMGPAQFVGAIRYDTAPCKPFEVHGYVDVLPCPVIPTVSPVPSTMAPTTMAPTLSSGPSMVPTFPVTPEPSYMPTTPSPSSSPPPTLSPTASPVKSTTTEMNLVLTLHTVPDVNMTETQDQFFINTLMDFFFLYTNESLRVEDASIAMQQTVDWAEEAARTRRHLRKLQQQQLTSQEYVSRAITVLVQAAYVPASYLNETDVETTIVDLVQANKQDFVISLRGGDESYFMQVDDIQAKAVEEVTLAPPATAVDAESKSVEEAKEAPEVESGSNVGVYAGVGVGVLVLCLVVVGIAHRFIKKRHIDKGFRRGNTNSNSVNSRDLESAGQLRSLDTTPPKFISPIDDDDVSSSEHSDTVSSKGDHSNVQDKENNSPSSSPSDCNQAEEHEHDNSVTKDEAELVNPTPDNEHVAEDVPGTKESEEEKPIPEMPKKSRKKKSNKAKKDKATKTKKSKKKQQSRKKDKVDTGDAIAAIISNNPIKPEESSDNLSSSSSSSDSDSDSSAPRAKKKWKTLQKAVKAGEIVETSALDAKLKAKNGKDNWAKLNKAVKTGEMSKQSTSEELGIAITDGEVSGSDPKSRSPSQKKDHWKTLSQSVNAGAPKSGPPRHRSRSLIISSSEDEDGKDRWKTLSKAVKERDFTNSETNPVRASRTKPASSENMHLSESNPGDVAFRRSTTAPQKDGLMHSIKTGEIKTGDTKKSKRRSLSVDVGKDDGKVRGSTGRQPSRRESSRAQSRDGADNLRKSSRGVSANGANSSTLRVPKRSESMRRSSSNSDLRQSQSSRNIGAYDPKRDELRRSKTVRNSDELRRSSRNLASGPSSDLKRSTTKGRSSDEWKKSRRRTVE